MDSSEDEKDNNENSISNNKYIYFNRVKTYAFEHHDFDKLKTSIHSPFEEQNEDIKEEEEENDENFHNYDDYNINKIKNIEKINFNKFNKNSNNDLLNSNSITNINNNKDTLNVDKIKITFFEIYFYFIDI